MLLAIDPGLRAPGLAIFDDDDEFLAATTYEVKGDRDAEDWLKGGYAASRWIGHQLDELGRSTARLHIAYEMMECYTSQDTEHANNDLLQCVGTLSSIITLTRLLDSSSGDLKRYLPREWKGNKAKEIVHRRMRKRLSEDERDRLDDCMQMVKKSIQHNALDAVSLGLVHLKRMRR